MASRSTTGGLAAPLVFHGRVRPRNKSASYQWVAAHDGQRCPNKGPESTLVGTFVEVDVGQVPH